MKKVKKVKLNGFYVFQGRSNANSCFIEKIIHAKQFLLYGNHFLKGYLSIYDYVITRDGWVLVVKIKNKTHFGSSQVNDEERIWRTISEKMRLFLSTFVRVTNRSKGRSGSLVHSSYERYCFGTLNEAKVYIESIRKQQIKMYSKKKKYRSLKTHYKISSRIGKGSIFLCSRDVRKKGFEAKRMGEVFDFIDVTKTVLLKMIDFTNQAHNSYTSIPITSFSLKNSS